MGRGTAGCHGLAVTHHINTTDVTQRRSSVCNLWELFSFFHVCGTTAQYTVTYFTAQRCQSYHSFFFFVLTCIDQWIVKYRGGKNPHSGCLFLKSSVTEYVTHNSRLISDSHELFLVCFPPFIFSPRWWSNCWETLTESQFSSVLLIELWRVADCSVTCFCEHWQRSAAMSVKTSVNGSLWYVAMLWSIRMFLWVFFIFYSSFCFLCLDFALNVIFQPHLYQSLWCPTVAGLKVL